MQINTVPVARGFDWIVEGFGLFRQNPLIWVVNIILFLALLTLLSLIPLVGAIASLLLQPVLVGGMLYACRSLEQGQELRVDHLFEGFRRNTNPLFMVGLISAAAYFVVGLVLFMVIAGSIGLGALGEGLTNDSALVVGGAMFGVLMSVLIGVALTVPIAMATWFAPALVIFNGLPPVEAMKSSFLACLYNMLPFLLYGIVALVLGLLAMIPFGLGMLALMPTLLASIYTGYRDVFRA